MASLKTLIDRMKGDPSLEVAVLRVPHPDGDGHAFAMKILEACTAEVARIRRGSLHPVLIPDDT